MLLQNKALELGLTGWVRNRRDGRVEVTAEGYEEDLQELLRWLHTGTQDTLQRHLQGASGSHSHDSCKDSLVYDW